ncbi:MAG: cytidylate kinase-like family protein [Lachnospiraceae bacterium]|nr:cytidylate kinase-like family protein [Lachnospiraceae bacterium]
MNKVITISRQYGSGGREVGQKLAKHYGIPFYDNEIIANAAKESGFAEVAFERAEEKATNSFLYSLAMGMSAYGNMDMGFSTMSVDDRLFLAETKVTRRFAQEGPCVIVGRCADYVLKDLPNIVNIFVMADLPARIKRAIENYELPREKAETSIIKFDKRRSNYYNYHTGKKWGDVNNYHIAIRSDFLGVDHTVQTLISYLGQ